MPIGCAECCSRRISATQVHGWASGGTSATRFSCANDRGVLKSDVALWQSAQPHRTTSRALSRCRADCAPFAQRGRASLLVDFADDEMTVLMALSRPQRKVDLGGGPLAWPVSGQRQK